MRTVKVKKTELIDELTANKAKHEKNVSLALTGYKADVVKKLEKKIEAVKNGKLITQVYFDIPENHAKDYDRALKQLDMSVDNEIELTDQEFQQYVMDEWGWKQQFLSSNSGYIATASLGL